MNFEVNSCYINKYKAFDKSKTNQMQNKHQNSINFTGGGKEYLITQNFINNFDKGAEGVIETIDRVLGKSDDGITGYFSDLLNKANINDLQIPKYKFIEGLTESVKGVFDLFNSLTHKITKHYISEKRAAQKAQYIAMDKAREILQVFEKCCDEGTDFDTKAAAEIANLAKNYETRDERTVNKLATSIVSAWFSANDFYNISMLQKNDDKEANKTRKARRKQELTRMAISASLTYLTLGAFDKIVRNKSYGSPIMIGVSTLIAEIFSRVLNKVKLTPLTPKKAEKIAKKNKEKEANKGISKPQNVSNNPSNEKNVLTTESALIKDGKIFQNIFKDSAQGSAYNLLIKNIAQEKHTNAANKKSKFKKNLLILFATANALFWIGKMKAGRGHGDVNSYLEMLKDAITKKKVEINIKKLDSYINAIKESTKGKEIETLLDEYTDFVNTYKNCATVTSKQERAILSGIVDGLLKIPKTIYKLLSIPSNALYHILFNEKNAKKGVDCNLLEAEKKQKELLDAKKKALHTLNAIIDKQEEKNGIKTQETISNIVDDIKKNTRNIQVKTAETGELANTSRTIVTGITTYFFINDYRNKVLLESEGKDVKGANAEVSERFAHKVANFAINGTLMNLGNSIFKGPLNASLGFAAILPFFTEILNESLIRKFICQPIGKMESRDAIIDYETKKLQSKGIGGAWSRTFKKITGKKSLTEKTGIQTQQQAQQSISK